MTTISASSERFTNADAARPTTIVPVALMPFWAASQAGVVGGLGFLAQLVDEFLLQGWPRHRYRGRPAWSMW